MFENEQTQLHRVAHPLCLRTRTEDGPRPCAPTDAAQSSGSAV